MRCKLAFACLLAGLVLGAVEQAAAAEMPAITGTTYYVSPTGSDSNSGTSSLSPWRTVKRVNEASLSAGDGVLFEGGASFPDETLMPKQGGGSGSPIVYGSYGVGNAILPKGIWFKGLDDLAFERLTVKSEGNIQGTGNDSVIDGCTVEGTDLLGINAMGNGWVIDNNTLDHIGNSGMLLEGESDTVEDNKITNTGLDSSISYGKHGIYLKVVGATVAGNVIEGFSSDGVSVRYRNSTVAGNTIRKGAIGIAWFQYDTAAGTSYWLDNTIQGTTDAGMYVSSENFGLKTIESFVIEGNLIEPASGVFTNLEKTSGTYTLAENTMLEPGSSAGTTTTTTTSSVPPTTATGTTTTTSTTTSSSSPTSTTTATTTSSATSTSSTQPVASTTTTTSTASDTTTVSPVTTTTTTTATTTSAPSPWHCKGHGRHRCTATGARLRRGSAKRRHHRHRRHRR